MKTLIEQKDEYIQAFIDKTGERPKNFQIEKFEELPYEVREAAIELTRGNEDVAREIYSQAMVVDRESLDDEEKRFYDLHIRTYGKPPVTTNIEAFRRMDENTRAYAFAILNSGKEVASMSVNMLKGTL